MQILLFWGNRKHGELRTIRDPMNSMAETKKRMGMENGMAMDNLVGKGTSRTTTRIGGEC